MPMQFTHLRLLDGDKNTIAGRMSQHLTHESKKLKEGDIIRLERFTELTHRPDDESPGRYPLVFITNYSVIGYNKIPDVKSLANQGNPIPCTTPAEAPPERKGSGPEGTEVEPCADGKCGCSMHGVSMLRCICHTNPVDRLNLQTVKEDCYFANKELDEMTLSQKRCMIYWWYATNIYSICGKKKRRQLPDCLVCSVRRLFPEPSGVYTGYIA